MVSLLLQPNLPLAIIHVTMPVVASCKKIQSLSFIIIVCLFPVKNAVALSWGCIYPVLFVSVHIVAQVRWVGSAGDGQWATASNWVGNIVPSAGDDVLLDNTSVTGNYTVSLPGSTETITVKSIVIEPASANTIQLVIPAASTAAPALAVTGPGYGITINAGGCW